MIDVHNFRFQLNDGGVSTSTTGSRSSALSCPRPMTREYESLFFRRFSSSFLASPLSHVTRSPLRSLLPSPSPLPPPFFVVFLFFAPFAFCTFPTDHYFLFVTLYDELVQVRCSRREAFTGSPFFAAPPLLPLRPSFPRVSSSLAGSPRLLVLPSFTSALFPVLPFCRAKCHAFSFRMFFNSVNEGKCEGRVMLRAGNARRRD